MFVYHSKIVRHIVACVAYHMSLKEPMKHGFDICAHTSSAVTGSHSAFSIKTRAFRCAMATPLGFPVVPDVYRTVSRLSWSNGCADAKLAALAGRVWRYSVVKTLQLCVC